MNTWVSSHAYVPDFLVRLSPDLTLVLEIKGYEDDQDRAKHQAWPVVPLDLGGLTKRYGIQAELKFDYALKALDKLGYQAVGFGPADLRLDILSLVLNSRDAKNLFVSANVGILDFDPEYSQRYKVIEAGGMKIGVTSVLGKKQMAALKNVRRPDARRTRSGDSQVLPELREGRLRPLGAAVVCRPGGNEGPRPAVPRVRFRRHGRRRRRAAERAAVDRRHQVALDRSRPQGDVRHRRRPLQKWRAVVSLSAGAARLAVRRLARDAEDDGRLPARSRNARPRRARSEAVGRIRPRGNLPAPKRAPTATRRPPKCFSRRRITTRRRRSSISCRRGISIRSVSVATSPAGSRRSIFPLSPATSA